MSIQPLRVAARRRQHGSGSVAVVAVRRQRGGGQRGNGVGQCGGSVAVAAWRRPAWRRCWQRGGGGAGSTTAAAGLAAAEEVWRHHSISGGSRAAGAALPLRAATVATKIPMATAMVGALPTINNQLKATTAMAMETTTTTTNKT